MVFRNVQVVEVDVQELKCHYVNTSAASGLRSPSTVDYTPPSRRHNTRSAMSEVHNMVQLSAPTAYPLSSFSVLIVS